MESIGLSSIGVSYPIGEVGYQAIISVSFLFPVFATKSSFECETHARTWIKIFSDLVSITVLYFNVRGINVLYKRCINNTL